MGWPSVAWGLAHISGYELAEWQVYDKFVQDDPWSIEYRLAYGFAELANIMIALWSSKNSGAKRLTPRAFMPTIDNGMCQPDDNDLKERIFGALGAVANIEHTERPDSETQD